MPTRKQRRRREKDRRHEYEYVYVDDEGKEVEPPPETDRAPAKASGSPAKGRSQAGARPRRGPREPSLKRSAAWAVGFAVVLALVTRSLFAALIYGVFLFLIMNLTERMVWRRYLRRTGQLPEAPAPQAKPKQADDAEPVVPRRSLFRR
jgi:hypothetical protein